ncbi:Alpha-ketoglutarate permease [Leucobacter aridicollis]|uniref:MFS transporter n=1 Tax=Leucobacter aridicollis TaxID=283878 RepID=UPI0037C5C87D
MRKTAAERATQRHITGNIFKGSVGNLIEWYDWYVYAAFSLYFSHQFFPSGNLTGQLLNTAAVFAVGFLMRPVGSLFFGRYADRHGRKAALTLSITVMAAGSLIIACTPGYETIGIAAPIILVFARLLQGLSLGGEYGTSATYLSEMASTGRRGFYSSFQYVTLISGQLTALGVQILLQQVLTEEQMGSWGWRIPFIIGAVGALAVLWLRRTMDESNHFKRMSGEQKKQAGSLRAVAKYPRAVLTVMGLTIGGTVAFFSFTTYLQKFMVNTSGIPKETVSLINFCALLIFVVLQPLVGSLSDRIGRRPILLAFGLLGAIITVPLFRTLAVTTDPVLAFLLMLGALVVVSGYTSINAIVKAELFPAEIRALGMGFPYAITVALFGGTAEYIALWLKSIGHEELFYFYVAACCALGFLVYFFMGETSRSSHIDREHHEAEATEQAQIDSELAAVAAGMAAPSTAETPDSEHVSTRS